MKKSTETRDVMVLQHSSVRKSLLCHIVRILNLAELCCNTTISLVSVLFLLGPLLHLYFKYASYLMFTLYNLC